MSGREIRVMEIWAGLNRGLDQVGLRSKKAGLQGHTSKGK